MSTEANNSTIAANDSIINTTKSAVETYDLIQAAGQVAEPVADTPKPIQVRKPFTNTESPNVFQKQDREGSNNI